MSEFNDFDDFDLEPLEDIIEDLDADDEIIGYQFVNFGRMMDFIKAGDDAQTALDKAKGQYGRVDDAVKIIDPRKE